MGIEIEGGRKRRIEGGGRARGKRERERGGEECENKREREREQKCKGERVQVPGSVTTV